MTIKTEGFHSGEFLLSEGNGKISREQIVVVAGEALPTGQILGCRTVDKRYTKLDPEAGDGKEVAAGVLYAPVDASDDERAAVAIVRLAEVSGEILTGLTSEAKADLAMRNIIVR